MSQIRVLLVCTGNVCRSVIAEAIVRNRLGGIIDVSSAGLLTQGEPADPDALAAILQLGLDPPVTHRSRKLERAMLADADLVIGLARQHAREAVVLDRAVFERSFTLRELVRRGEALGPRADDEPFDDWLARLHDGRQTIDLLGDDQDDDIADPRGGTRDEYAAVAATVTDLVERLTRLLAHGHGTERTDLAIAPAALMRWAAPSAQGDRTPLVVSVAVDTAGLALLDVLADELEARGYGLVEATSPQPAASWLAAGNLVAQAVTDDPAELGLCASASAAGTATAANRYPDVRAVATADAATARAAREQVASNVLCVDVSLATPVLARAALAAFLDAVPGADPTLTAGLDARATFADGATGTAQ